jgi:TatD DNase family protein
MLIDTHSHLNFSSFNEDREEVIKRSLDSDIWMINVGVNLKTSQEVVTIAEQYSTGVYAAIGLHPIDLNTGLTKIKISEEEGVLEKEFDYQKYKQLAENPKVVAIGEIGLDYYWKPKTAGRLEQFKQKQKDLLLKELELAQELNLPIIFHCRMAHEDLLEILNTNTKLRGVIHCFTGTWEQAQRYLDLGFYLGFNGIIFKLNLEEVIKKIPLNRVLIETDCPYLLPPAALNGKYSIKDRNEPVFVKYVAKKIAEIKNIAYEDLAKATVQNAKDFFKI